MAATTTARSRGLGISSKDMEASRLVFVFVRDSKPRRKVAVPVPDSYSWEQFLDQVKIKLKLSGISDIYLSSSGQRVRSVGELQDIDELCVVEGGGGGGANGDTVLSMNGGRRRRRRRRRGVVRDRAAGRQHAARRAQPRAPPQRRRVGRARDFDVGQPGRRGGSQVRAARQPGAAHAAAPAAVAVCPWAARHAKGRARGRQRRRRRRRARQHAAAARSRRAARRRAECLERADDAGAVWLRRDDADDVQPRAAGAAAGDGAAVRRGRRACRAQRGCWWSGRRCSRGRHRGRRWRRRWRRRRRRRARRRVGWRRRSAGDDGLISWLLVGSAPPIHTHCIFLFAEV